MAHIHHFRTLEQVQRRSLQEVRSDRHAAANFAAFCGGRGSMKWSAAAASAG